MSELQDDFTSGNAYYGKGVKQNGKRQEHKAIDVQVMTQTVDGLELPRTIRLPDGKEFQVERVHGSRRDPERGNALRYAVRIGKRNTFVWRREDGAWFVAGK